jgi:hypothetical protein
MFKHTKNVAYQIRKYSPVVMIFLFFLTIIMQSVQLKQRLYMALASVIIKVFFNIHAVSMVGLS